MKTPQRIHLLTAALGLAAFATAGCTEKVRSGDATLPSAKVVAATTVTVAASAPASSVPVVTPVSSLAVSAQWADIKDHTYDQRAQFLAGFKHLEASVDAQIGELTDKRAAMNSTVNTKDWDFAMKEMGNARSYLKATGEDLSKATPETWNQEKDKVGKAWVRTQDAYAKVKSSTTS